MDARSSFWPKMFIAAALFNFVIGLPIIFVTEWTYTLSFVQDGSEVAANTIRFWRDFGFCVFFIGVGYYFIARDTSQNHGLVWLGIFSKLFDVINLSTRYFSGVANFIVMIPAVIDAAFVVLFVWFLLQYRGLGGPQRLD